MQRSIPGGRARYTDLAAPYYLPVPPARVALRFASRLRSQDWTARRCGTWSFGSFCAMKLFPLTLPEDPALCQRVAGTLSTAQPVGLLEQAKGAHEFTGEANIARGRCLLTRLMRLRQGMPGVHRLPHNGGPGPDGVRNGQARHERANEGIAMLTKPDIQDELLINHRTTHGLCVSRLAFFAARADVNTESSGWRDIARTFKPDEARG